MARWITAYKGLLYEYFDGCGKQCAILATIVKVPEVDGRGWSLRDNRTGAAYFSDSAAQLKRGWKRWIDNS